MTPQIEPSPAEPVEGPAGLLGQFLCRPWWRYAGVCLLLVVLFGIISDALAFVFGSASDGVGIAGGVLVIFMLAFLCLGLYVRVFRADVMPHVKPDVGTFTKRFGALAMTIKLLSVAGCLGGSEAWTEHEFGGAYALRVPASFTQWDNPNQLPGSVSLNDVGNDLYVIVVAVPKVDFTARTAEEFAKHSANLRENTLKNATTQGPEVTTADNRPQAMNTVRGSADGLNLVYVEQHIDFGNDWVKVQVWTTASGFQKHQQTMLAIADGVRTTVTN